MRPSTTLALSLLSIGSVGCATEPSSRDEVSAGSYGGIIEYDLFDFSGGGLSLGLAGLAGLDEVGGRHGFAPPYSLVRGFGVVVDAKLDGIESYSTISRLPAEEDACLTSVGASGLAGSFTTTDLGDRITFTALDGEAVFSMNRYPASYPPQADDGEVWYAASESWRPQPIYGLVPGTTSSALDAEQRVLRSANFPFGETVEMSFRGALPPDGVPVGSIPLPSSHLGNGRLVLPQEQEGIRLSWDGPRFDLAGEVISDGEQAACLDYFWPEGTEVPPDAEGCAAAEHSYGGEGGQIYTGPWSTRDGALTIQWTVPNEALEGEVLSLSVRLLGAVDREDHERFGAYMVSHGGGDPRCGREAMSCEGDVGAWVFDPSYLDIDWTDPPDAACGDGSYPLDDAPLIPSLQGDPLHTVAEVGCRLRDDGEFVLTDELMAEAYAYAMQHRAAGAVLLFTRTRAVEVEVPDVKSPYDQRMEISPVLLNARSVVLGRLWFGDFDHHETTEG
jgi:hypothetical protein